MFMVLAVLIHVEGLPGWLLSTLGWQCLLGVFSLLVQGSQKPLAAVGSWCAFRGCGQTNRVKRWQNMR
jgi:hypothetical protein